MTCTRLLGVCLFVAFVAPFGGAAFGDSVPNEFQSNYDDGYGSGYTVGYDAGLTTGKVKGTAEGSSTGHADGYTAGYGETYQPAFDHAYDAQYPTGNRAGWVAGVQDGFSKGYEQAPVIYQAWLDSGATISVRLGLVLTTNVYGNFGGTDTSGADYTVWRDNLGQDYDWGKHYFDVGYTDGKSAGDLVGSQDGYNLTYPVAYAKAFPAGHTDGIAGGIREGTSAGSASGYGDGFSSGQSTGYDLGFTAGVQYHLFGKYAQPVYRLNYAQRATGPAPVPEPTSLALFGIAAAGAATFRRGNRRS